MKDGTTEIVIRTEGRAGRATMNRPKALNALTHQMCLSLEDAMTGWAGDPSVHLVMVDGTGEKAFCAGGDIVGLYHAGRAGNFETGQAFWRDEYRLNNLIAGYDKPYVVFMDGFVMGGGVGVSAHGSHRIVTERTQLAMPECGIGLIPDVGGTWLLARMPGSVGEYAGLTGARLSAADCLYGGFADHYVPAEKLEALKARLAETGDAGVIAEFAEDPGPSPLAQQEGEINAVFGLGSMTEIVAMLDGAQSEFAQKTLKTLQRSSPMSMLLTLDAIRQARAETTLAAVLRNEFRCVCLALQEGDFLEGIRAQLIDRDRTPTWAHPSLSAVPQELLARVQAPAPGGDLEL